MNLNSEDHSSPSKAVDLESTLLDQSTFNNNPSQISKPHSDQPLQTLGATDDANDVTSRTSGSDLENFMKFSSSQVSLQRAQSENVDWSQRPTIIRRFSSNSSSILSESSSSSSSTSSLSSSDAIGRATSHFNLNDPELVIEEVSELEDLEIDELIRRTSKEIHQQNHQPGTDYHHHQQTQQADPNDISTASGKVENTRRVGGDRSDESYYSIEYLYDLLAKKFEAHCPSSSLSGPLAPVSISRLKTNLERFYVLAPPELLHNLWESGLGDIYRWKDPRRTMVYLIIYYSLWFFDLIPSFLVIYVIYRLIDRRLHPPPASEVKLEFSRRRRFVLQAEALRKELLPGHYSGGRSRALTKGLSSGASVLAATGTGLSITSKTKSDQESRETDRLQNFKCGEVGLKTMDNVGLYSLSRGLYSYYGHLFQYLLEDLADIGEKIRNLYLWRRPSGSRRTCLKLLLVLIYTSSISQRVLLKNFLGTLGFQFFFVLGFNERYPKYRKFMNPIWLMLWDVPTDQEFVLQILEERRLNGSLTARTVGENDDCVGGGGHRNLRKILKRRKKGENGEGSETGSINDQTRSRLSISSLKERFSLKESEKASSVNHSIRDGRNGPVEAINRISESVDHDFGLNSGGGNGKSGSLLKSDNLKRWSVGVLSSGTEVYKKAKNLYAENLEKVINKPNKSN